MERQGFGVSACMREQYGYKKVREFFNSPESVENVTEKLFKVFSHA
jgi:hypothetical protein